MAKFVSDDSVMEDIESQEQDEIKPLVEKYIVLRKSGEESDKTAEHCTNHISKLLESNSSFETNYHTLMMKASNTDEQMSETMKIHTIIKRKMEDLQRTRADLLNKEWDNYRSEAGNYSNNFCKWLTGYTNNVLMKDIKNHQEECKKIKNDFLILKQELNDIEREHDWDHVEVNSDIDDFLNLTTIASDVKYSNNNLTNVVRLTEMTLDKIQKKTEQYKGAVKEYKTKKNMNMF